jgi:HEAT repeats
MREGEDDLEKILLDKRLPRSARKSAAQALGRPSGISPKAAEAKANILEGVLLDEKEDHRLRKVAARSLGILKCRRSMPALLTALDGRCPAIRHEAIEALGSMGCPEATPALEKLLKGQSRYLRRLASIALINICGLPEGLPGIKDRERLFSLLASGDERVAEALMRGEGPSFSFLMDKLNSSSFYERQLSSWALAIVARKALDIGKGKGQSPAPSRNPISCRNLTSPKYLSRLYSFRIHRMDGAVTAVENSGFDDISRILRGRGRVDFHPPKLALMPPCEAVNLGDLLMAFGAEDSGLGDSEIRAPRIMGRTLIFAIDGGCLAIKFPSKPEDEEKLSWEASIQKCMIEVGLRGSIPEPLGGIFELNGLSFEMKKALGAAGCRVLAYTAERDYFIYLNYPRLRESEFQRGLEGCASDLGRITARGMIHRSLIPLFHRREASPSRPDGGAYCWSRRAVGSLESWAESCRYPNLRLSGLADFEHVEVSDRASTGDIQQAIGEHLLSLCLMIGSYFRSREAFEVASVEPTIKLAFNSYLGALTGKEPVLNGYIDWEEIAFRMKEEMSSGDHLGLSHGPFPLPEMVRAIHLASLLAVLDLTDRSALEQGLG